MPPLTPPTNIGGMMGTPYMNIHSNCMSITNNDRGSCSADSGLRGSSDKESASGDLNLSDGAENGICLSIDPDSISIISGQHLYQSELDYNKRT